MREHFEDKDVDQRGFTLIEVVVVVTILSLLAAIVVFAVGRVTDRGHSSACKSEITTLNTAIEAFSTKAEPSPRYPAGPLASLGSQLIDAGLLSSSSVVPGASANYAPAYDAIAGTYTATCP